MAQPCRNGPDAQLRGAARTLDCRDRARAITDDATLLERTLFEVKKVIVGQDHLVERLIVAALAGGHVLLEGLPGLAKTLAAETLATVVGGSFARIQFTPDLLPADITGTRIYRASTEQFDVELGPVFVNFLLADEINRAPAKVQSALLEVMGEYHVSIGGTTYPVPQPFMVVATQNPIESEGVYPLPEAQRDRFLMKVVIDHPSRDEEIEIVRRMGVDPPSADEMMSLGDLARIQEAARTSIYVDRGVQEYAVDLVCATRDPGSYDLDRPGAAAGLRGLAPGQPRPAGRGPGARAAAAPVARAPAGRVRRGARRAAATGSCCRTRRWPRASTSTTCSTGCWPPSWPRGSPPPRTGRPSRCRRRPTTGPHRPSPASIPNRPAACRRTATPEPSGPGMPAGSAVTGPNDDIPRLGDHAPDEVLRRLELAVTRRLDGLLQGDYRGLVPGHGSESGETRRYVAGDDVRRIDWNVTARMQDAPRPRDDRRP